MDKIKDIFLLFQLSKAELLYFNIPKLYTIIYYIKSIQQLKAITGTDIEYLEQVYKLQKEFYCRINKWNNYKEQML